MSMSPAPEELPAVLNTRPTSLTVLGVLGIIFGAAGILCVGGLLAYGLIKGDPNMEHAPPTMMMVNIGLTAIGVVLSLFLMIGSIGLLNLRPWSRSLMLVWAWVDLIFDAAKFAICVFYILPIIMELFQTYPPPGVTPQVMPMVRIASIAQWGVIFLVTAGFSVFILLVLSRPNVKAALSEPAIPEPSP